MLHLTYKIILPHIMHFRIILRHSGGFYRHLNFSFLNNLFGPSEQHLIFGGESHMVKTVVNAG
jgi:hypothetical protein